MSNSPLIRTAVKLCLIAAMVIQPMALLAAQGTCVQETTAGGCCQAQTASHACRCCQSQTAVTHGSCCSGDAVAVGCCTKPATDRSQADERFASPDQTTISSCMCGMRSEPIAPSPQPVRVLQSSDLVVIGFLDHAAMDAERSFRPDRDTSQLPIGKRSPHFSQRLLCVWRI